jgi:UDPglucose 6-dehydrogenase
MRVSVIGCGHLGAPHAAAMAELGHEVIGIELDPDKCAALSAGIAPFYEEGFAELLAEHVGSGRLRFCADLAAAADFAELHFLAVGTPLRADGRGYDISCLTGVVESLAPLLRKPCTIVGKSTVTVGTVAALQRIIDARSTIGEIELVWNPEFLREGHAVHDSLSPDRIVAGVGSAAARKAMEEVYAPILARGVEMIVTDPATAEMVKSAANAFLCTKISYINALSEACGLAGADVNTVAHAIGIDERIGHAGMRPGIGYGGGCLPKDVAAFSHRLGELGADRARALLESVREVNAARIEVAAELIERAHGGPLDGVPVAFLGASFKAGTSDLRHSPALALVDRLIAHGARPVVHDPEAMPGLRRQRPDLRCADTVEEALAGADVVVIATEWPQYTKDASLPARAGAAARSRVLVDVRNAVEADPWSANGWHVWQLGRPALHPQHGIAAAAGAGAR